jgi:hypothetical protein
MVYFEITFLNKRGWEWDENFHKLFLQFKTFQVGRYESLWIKDAQIFQISKKWLHQHYRYQKDEIKQIHIGHPQILALR